LGEDVDSPSHRADRQPVWAVNSVSDGRRAEISPDWICSRSSVASCRYGCCDEFASITVTELTMVKHDKT
jgi:hypothetical protein